MGQLFYLYSHSQDREFENMRFMAAVHGIDVDKYMPLPDEKKVEAAKTDLVFGAPEDYDRLTDQEKQDLTKKMMAKYGKLAANFSEVTQKVH